MDLVYSMIIFSPVELGVERVSVVVSPLRVGRVCLHGVGGSVGDEGGDVLWVDIIGIYQWVGWTRRSNILEL
jgi:hypothetical protein